MCCCSGGFAVAEAKLVGQCAVALWAKAAGGVKVDGVRCADADCKPTEGSKLMGPGVRMQLAQPAGGPSRGVLLAITAARGKGGFQVDGTICGHSARKGCAVMGQGALDASMTAERDPCSGGRCPDAAGQGSLGPKGLRFPCICHWQWPQALGVTVDRMGCADALLAHPAGGSKLMGQGFPGAALKA